MPKYKIGKLKYKGNKFHTIIFLDDNDIMYGLDHHVGIGIPTNVTFIIESKSMGSISLVADGYGMLPEIMAKTGKVGKYGNGSLYVKHGHLPAEIIKDLEIYIEPEWIGELARVSQLPDRKDLLSDQLNDLVQIANKFGMNKASKWIKQLTNEK